MGKRGNGEGSIYPVRDRSGRVKGYRGAYFVHTAEGPKRRYVSGKTRALGVEPYELIKGEE
ncbi:hypothetical protein [Rubrobacter naiadicus]|uniref:hypothetical protein n=1 Tax=Rubrobacter naiadicus TaxID=1392641 RepID=UPI00235E40D1|nr:hypothetical protein [Rubrobacter naiadicus]